MTTYPTHEPSQPEGEMPPSRAPRSGTKRPLGEHDLDAALRLLVARAQYITGATGAALALLYEDEMVCVASAGSSAPTVGARLQVLSGLTGEAISRKQLLRCDNAESDGRVNLDTCRELGIASIAVLPLLSRTGNVRGLFELFSDHPYAFEERDLVALERMADLTRTALDLAEKRPAAIIVPARPPEQRRPVEPLEANAADPAPVVAAAVPVADPDSVISPDAPEDHAQSASVPDAMRRVQKCFSCGFPVSEGRTLCVDCDQKRHTDLDRSENSPVGFVPTFGGPQASEESWLASHVNVLAVLVLILSVVVAVVVFR